MKVVIMSDDNRSFLWKEWEIFFKKFWDFSNDWEILYVVREKDAKFDIARTFKGGDVEWSDRLKNALKSFDDEYIFFLLDDCWIDKRIEKGELEELFALHKKYDMNVLRLQPPCSYYRTVPTDIYFRGKQLKKLTSDSAYLISHQPSIWKKQFFIDNLYSNENPWKNEQSGTNRLRTTKNVDYKIYLYEMEWYTHVVGRHKLNKNYYRLKRKVNDN